MLHKIKTMQQNRKIKVLQAIRQGQVGGGETHILNLVREMDKNTYEPVVLSFTGGQMIDSLNKMGIANHVIATEKPMDIRVWKAVKRLLIREKIDLVHVHGTRANSNVYWAARSLGIPVVYTIHGWSFHDDQPWHVKKMRVAFEKWITKRTTCNISVSSSNQQTGRRYIKGFHSFVVNNGIDLQVFHPQQVATTVRSELGIPASACVVGFIGRMTEQKDPLTLIRAFKTALTQYPQLVLLMVGEGTLQQEAIELAAQLGIAQQVIFTPFRQDVPALLQAIDIYCLPSLWEGLPIGLLEAMAMEKAVIATAVDGSKEIVQHAKNGMVVPKLQPQVLAETILSLAREPFLRKLLGRNARRTVAAGFDVAAMTRRVEYIYRETLPFSKKWTHGAARAITQEDLNEQSVPFYKTSNYSVMKNDTACWEYNRIADRKRVEFIADTLQQSLPRGARILDVGCGNGVISRHLGRLGFEVTGIDISDKAIEKARQMTNLPNVRFLRKSAEELVSAGERYDAIVCSEVLEHLNDPGSLLLVLHESLTDKGKLIVTVPNGQGPRETLVTKPVLSLRNSQGWLWRTIVGVKRLLGYQGTTVQSAADNLDHVQFFSRRDLERLSRRHQFIITRFGKANFIEDVFPFSFLTRKVTWLQKVDCRIADWLPARFSGGFFTVWEKTGKESSNNHLSVNIGK
jgi:glycosyltransferase involved in cell wall biosynthesis